MSSDSQRAFGRVDLASVRLGAVVLQANDDFFAPKENLIKAEPAVFLPDEYTDRGKWMDGWESRRRRTPGHDWCIVRLGAPGTIDELVVDTSHFRGNHPEACSVDGWLGAGDPPPDSSWERILERSPLQGHTANRFELAACPRVSHLRLNIFPDGGVARLRAFGRVQPDWQSIAAAGQEVDLAAAVHGGLVLDCSDRFFSAPENLLLPGASTGMHDGWETRRRRGPGHDWCIVQLGRPGRIHRVEVATSFFKGNYPDRCSVQITAVGSAAELESATWQPLLGETKLQADFLHAFAVEPSPLPATHARFNIYPDGGVARLRLYGSVAP